MQCQDDDSTKKQRDGPRKEFDADADRSKISVTNINIEKKNGKFRCPVRETDVHADCEHGPKGESDKRDRKMPEAQARLRITIEKSAWQLNGESTEEMKLLNPSHPKRARNQASPHRARDTRPKRSGSETATSTEDRAQPTDTARGQQNSSLDPIVSPPPNPEEDRGVRDRGTQFTPDGESPPSRSPPPNVLDNEAVGRTVRTSPYNGDVQR